MRASANLPAGTAVSTVGIYVVSHDKPRHATPHDCASDDSAEVQVLR